jgi:hypothetical protein
MTRKPVKLTLIWKEIQNGRARGRKLLEAGRKLWWKWHAIETMGSKISRDGSDIWTKAVTQAYGRKVFVRWTSFGCKVKGQSYYYEMTKQHGKKPVGLRLAWMQFQAKQAEGEKVRKEGEKVYGRAQALLDKGHNLLNGWGDRWKQALVKTYGPDIVGTGRIEWTVSGCKIDGVEYLNEEEYRQIDSELRGMKKNS